MLTASVEFMNFSVQFYSLPKNFAGMAVAPSVKETQ
jgi:hypothetical protein